MVFSLSFCTIATQSQVYTIQIYNPVIYVYIYSLCLGIDAYNSVQAKGCHTMLQVGWPVFNPIDTICPDKELYDHPSLKGTERYRMEWKEVQG